MFVPCTYSMNIDSKDRLWLERTTNYPSFNEIKRVFDRRGKLNRHNQEYIYDETNDLLERKSKFALEIYSNSGRLLSIQERPKGTINRIVGDKMLVIRSFTTLDIYKIIEMY